MDPLKVINAAIKAVPAIRLALGLAGVAAATSIIRGFVSGSGRVVVLSIGLMLIAMVVLYLIANATTDSSKDMPPQSKVLLWSITIFICVLLLFLLTALAIRWPEPIAELIGVGNAQAQAEKKTDSGVVACEEQWDADSGWREGGSSPTQFCGAQKISRESQFPNRRVTIVTIPPESHETKRDPFKRDFYRYTCIFKDQWTVPAGQACK